MGAGCERLVGKIERTSKSYGSIEATYTSIMVDKMSDFEATQAGTIYVDGNKYSLDIGDYLIISDGTTIWTYEPAVNDCYVDDAEMMAEEGMDPSSSSPSGKMISKTNGKERLT